MLTAGAIWAPGLFSGLFWLLMGLTGAVTWIAKITSRPVVHGLILSLGLAFIIEEVDKSILFKTAMLQPSCS